MRRAQSALAAALLAAAAGCSGGSETAEVRGRVTLDGEPIPAGAIRFVPADGKAPTDSSHAVTAVVLTFAGQELTAGLHKLSVEIIGANPHALPRYLFGLDYVRLRPAAP